MRRIFAATAALAVVLAMGSAHAVSGGQYSPERQHCSGSADNYNKRGTAEPDCMAVITTVMDATGHEYFGAGAHQSGSGFQHLFDVWIDPGLGTKYVFQIDSTAHTITPEPPAASTAGDPTSGLWVYFGADDNLDGGEHDGAPSISNGPSDGGGLAVKLSQAAAARFINDITTTNIAGLLASPLPIETAGGGGCADGLCFPGVAAVKATILRGGSPDGSRMAADYEGVNWPPSGCSGASAKELAACVDEAHPNGIIDWFNEVPHDVYVAPGLSIYEDPDPQASPLTDNGQPGTYQTPIPALYFGSCGFIFGGGSQQFTGPGTNTAGQVAILNPLC